MTDINDKFNSLSFTLILIVSMLFGILTSIFFSGSLGKHIVEDSFKLSNHEDFQIKYFDYGNSKIVESYKSKFNLYESPISSVPVKLELGKIIKLNIVENKKLEHLVSILDQDTSQTVFEDYFHFDISRKYYSPLD